MVNAIFQDIWKRHISPKAKFKDINNQPNQVYFTYALSLVLTNK